MGFLDDSAGEEPTCQGRRHRTLGLDSFRKILWRRKWQPTPVRAWKIPWSEKPGRLQSNGLQRVDTEWLSRHTYIHAYLNIKLYIYMYERETLELHFSLIGKKKWKDLEAYQDTGAIFTTRKFLGKVSLSFYLDWSWEEDQKNIWMPKYSTHTYGTDHYGEVMRKSDNQCRTCKRWNR